MNPQYTPDYLPALRNQIEMIFFIKNILDIENKVQNGGL